MNNKWIVSVFVFASLAAALKAEDKILQNLSSLKDDLPRFYTQAIDQLFLTTNPVSIAKYIADIYINNDLVTYQVMTNAQLYLFWKYQSNSNKNEQYLLDVGYFFYKIQKDANYSQLTAATTANLRDAIDQLPGSVQYLYFRPYFCLLNNAYAEFIYTTAGIEIDNERRYIFTWRDPNSIAANGQWVHAITEVSTQADNELKLQFQFISKPYRMYLYLERNVASTMNLITAWRNGVAPPNSSWTVQLVKNQLVFNQANGYFMCSVEKTRDAKRRFVYGVSGVTTNDAKCQWIAKACP